MSLLQRANASQPQSQQKNQGSPFRRSNNPFGSRSGSSPFGSRSKQPQNQQLANVIVLAEKTVVRFSLDGMGDPFYRLLGHEMTPDYGNVQKLSEVLQKGGKAVDELVAVLDKAWDGYNLTGAMLIYNHDPEIMGALQNPSPMPAAPTYEDEDDNDNDNEDNTPTDEPHPDYQLERLRSIDLTLTLNVLSRARSQVLIARAPVVFGMEYLTRSLVTDDPRLVSLAKATGSLPEN